MQDLKTRTSQRVIELKDLIVRYSAPGFKARAGVKRQLAQNYRINMQLLRAMQGKWVSEMNDPEWHWDLKLED